MNAVIYARYSSHNQTEQSEERDRKNRKNIRDVELAIGNLTRSIEQGLPYDLVKSRIEELNGERVVLAATLADKKVSGQMELTRDHIVYFLEQFRNLDYQDRKCQKKLIIVLGPKSFSKSSTRGIFWFLNIEKATNDPLQA